LSGQIRAILAEIALASASDDGQFVVITFALQNGCDLTLALPVNNAVNLMALNAAAIGHAAKIQTKNSEEIYMFPVHWWKIGTHEGNGAVVLTYRLPGGAEIAFQVSPDAASHMHTVLGEILKVSKTSLPPGGKVN